MQENIRSHMQNELNERNKNSITQSLGDESNRISNLRMQNEFVLGTQGNAINQQNANTNARRATQDYDIGLKTVKNVITKNKQDYELGTIANKIKATDVSNNFIIGQGNLANTSIRNAQDFALGKLQQASYAKMADAASLTAGTKLAQLSPVEVVVALGAEGLQDGANTVINKGKQTVPAVVQKVVRYDYSKPVQKPKPVTVPLKGMPVTPRQPQPTPNAKPPKPATPSKPLKPIFH